MVAPGAHLNRACVFASESVHAYWHNRLREIAREWASTPLERGEFAHEIEARMALAAKMREAARTSLRAEVRALVSSGFAGPYLIPV